MSVPCLVTGATGFVGTAVVRELLEHGYRVIALVRAGSDRRNLEGLKVEIREGRLEDADSLARALDGAAALFHVAADYRLWVPDPAPMFRANVEGTMALMAAALRAGVGRIVHTSSVAALGHRPDDAPADETTPVAYADMIGAYKQTKFRSEEAVLAMVARQRLPAVVVNPSVPVGPRDIKPTPSGRMVLDAARGRIPAYVDTGLNLVHVADVATGHRLAFEHGRIGERYVLSGENLALADVLRTIAGIAGRRPPRLRLPIGPLVPVAILAEAAARRLGFVPPLTRDQLHMARRRMYFSHAKATAELGYRPRAAADGLSDAVAWFRDHGYLGRA
ncbi:MAG: NAD-dependent epimerase/dehydratase family protein [Alphaproteobacteria bacterium]|nr:NAD-dependent epimerase/dehydratase family protein [Alphaproteobacteria bacterium]